MWISIINATQKIQSHIPEYSNTRQWARKFKFTSRYTDQAIHKPFLSGNKDRIDRCVHNIDIYPTEHKTTYMTDNACTACSLDIHFKCINTGKFPNTLYDYAIFSQLIFHFVALRTLAFQLHQSVCGVFILLLARYVGACSGYRDIFIIANWQILI